MIYRVDPATGKASIFFDLNTVMNQIDPNALTTDGVNPAANSLGASTGYVNWYDIAFDPEGYYQRQAVMFVSSVDRSDPSKNAIYRISPDGKFMGAFVTFTQGLAATKFNVNPTGMVIPGPEDQNFFRGLDRRQRHHLDRRDRSPRSFSTRTPTRPGRSSATARCPRA